MTDLTRKILITLGFLFLYKSFAYISVPGVDVGVIKNLFNQEAGNLLKMANMFSGNAIQQFSIVSLGIMPYITASIIMELVAASFKSIGQLKKEKEGMEKYIKIIKYTTVLIATIQTIGIAVGIYAMQSNAILIDKNLFITLAVITMVTTTMVLVWIGEQITQKGIGNGISLIIFTGIVTSIPSGLVQMGELLRNGELSFFVLLGFVVIVVGTTVGIIYVESGERKIPVSYVKNGQDEGTKIMNYIPIKLNIAGIIPPIFASAVLMFPITVLSSSQNPFLKSIADHLHQTGLLYNILMFVLVVFFSYFYTSIVFNSKEISENLQKQNSYIQGIRPGQPTQDYLDKIVTRLTFSGSMYLGIISTIPWFFVREIGIPFYFGGTMILIVVQVAIDTMKKYQAEVNNTNLTKHLNISTL
jgi:preprotein translocase subunit SecY